MRMPTAIDAIATDHTRRLAALWPTWATEMGLPGHDAEMGDFSPANHAAYADLNRETLRRLAAVQPVDPVDEVTVAAMRDRLGLAIEQYEAGEWRADANNLASPVQALRDVFDLMATDTVADWETIRSRLAGLPAAVDGYLACLRAGLAAGPRPTRRQAEVALADAEVQADPATSFFVAFLGGARPADGELPDALREDLATAGRRAGEAYARLAGVLRDEVLPGAPEADSIGRERWELASRDFLGARIDPDETYEWGLARLADLVAEQRAVAARIVGPGASVAEAIAALDDDPARILHGTDALVAWMEATSAEAIQRVDGVAFDLPEPVRHLECRIAPTATGGIYYTGPSDDGSRPGRMWWSVPAGVTDFTTWRERTTVYHEGVPGHHLQIGTAVAHRDDLNDWRRLACWVSGHGEGWALYAERLMADLGFLDDPGDRMGMLDAQVLRAARVVFDLGVHLGKPAPEAYGGGTWDADKGWELLRRHVASDEATLRFEWNRYLTWPGQAPSYAVGQRLWQRLRDEARTRAEARGEEFSLKDFHGRALALGSVPLEVLRAAV